MVGCVISVLLLVATPSLGFKHLQNNFVSDSDRAEIVESVLEQELLTQITIPDFAYIRTVSSENLEFMQPSQLAKHGFRLANADDLQPSKNFYVQYLLFGKISRRNEVAVVSLSRVMVGPPCYGGPSISQREYIYESRRTNGRWVSQLIRRPVDRFSTRAKLTESRFRAAHWPVPDTAITPHDDPDSEATISNDSIDIASISFPGIVPVAQDEDTVVIDSFIARQAQRERGEEYREARKVLVGDLTHDGTPETVVLYTIESQRGSNLYLQYLAVFARQNGKLSGLTHMVVGGKSIRSIELTSVENNSIVLDTTSYGPKDASCCPSVKGTTRYVLAGRKLREQKRKVSSR